MSLGDRMKFYESNNKPEIMLNTLPTIIRIDGRAFHTFTRNMECYDRVLKHTMNILTTLLVKETNAIIGYNQSDEISLILYAKEFKSEIYFGGKRDKINSILAAYTSVWFNRYLEPDTGQVFDCRTFQVPNLWEACNYLIWREEDAVRNSIQSLARSQFSHKECENKNCSNLQDMLMTKGINWNNCSDEQKRGTYYKRYGSIVEQSPFPRLTEIANLPEVIFDDATTIFKE